MNNKKLQELKDDAEADSLVASLTLNKLISAISNIKDYSRVIEALMKYIKNKKGSSLNTLSNNMNYNKVMEYLGKLQSEEADNSKDNSKTVAQK